MAGDALADIPGPYPGSAGSNPAPAIPTRSNEGAPPNRRGPFAASRIVDICQVEHLPVNRQTGDSTFARHDGNILRRSHPSGNPEGAAAGCGRHIQVSLNLPIHDENLLALDQFGLRAALLALPDVTIVRPGNNIIVANLIDEVGGRENSRTMPTSRCSLPPSFFPGFYLGHGREFIETSCKPNPQGEIPGGSSYGIFSLSCGVRSSPVAGKIFALYRLTFVMPVSSKGITLSTR